MEPEYGPSPPSVAQSAITVQFMHDKFLERYDPTVEDSYRYSNLNQNKLDSTKTSCQSLTFPRKELEVDGGSCTLDILDTAGQDEYRGKEAYFPTLLCSG